MSNYVMGTTEKLNDKYTQCMKLMIIDDNKNIVDNEELLEKIKMYFLSSVTHKILHRGEKHDIDMKWELLKIKPYDNLYGDLFTYSIFGHTHLFYDHTQLTIDLIKSSLNITHNIVFVIMPIFNINNPGIMPEFFEKLY